MDWLVENGFPLDVVCPFDQIGINAHSDLP